MTTQSLFFLKSTRCLLQKEGNRSSNSFHFGWIKKEWMMSRRMMARDVKGQTFKGNDSEMWTFIKVDSMQLGNVMRIAMPLDSVGRGRVPFCFAGLGGSVRLLFSLNRHAHIYLYRYIYLEICVSANHEPLPPCYGSMANQFSRPLACSVQVRPSSRHDRLRPVTSTPCPPSLPTPTALLRRHDAADFRRSALALGVLRYLPRHHLQRPRRTSRRSQGTVFHF